MNEVSVDACYFCGEVGPEGSRYCIECGHALEVDRCQSCHRLVAPSSLFCGSCGAPFGGGAPVSIQAFPEDQLRQVTVLFVMLIGLRELIEQLDPEAFRDLLEECFSLLTTEVRSRGGTIDKYLPDSVLALFGAPIAHEDDPTRAVRAALDMVSAIEKFNERMFEQHGFQLGVKIGINTGKVLVGPVGTGAQGITVTGDVVNTASRVQNAAPVGGIYVCESTRRGLGELFQLVELPPLTVKGKALPLKVFRVMNSRGEPYDGGLDLSHLPLVGREEPFDRLARSWLRVVRPGDTWGRPKTPVGIWVRLVGEVGTGKERLLQEFQQYALRDPCGPGVHTTRGTSISTGSGPEVLRRLVGSLAGVTPEDDLAGETEKILALSQKIAGKDPKTGEPIWGHAVAYSIHRLIGIRDLGPSTEPLPALDPARIHQQGISYLYAIVAKLAKERPLLIMAFELQWAPDVALDFFEKLGSDPPPRLLLVTSGRPSLLERRPEWAEENATSKVVTLEPLSLRDCHRLARLMIGERRFISLKFAKALHRFTGGNLFYLTETLRSYLEGAIGKLEEEEESELEVPDSLEGVLQSRLDRLSFEEGLTLRAAAVIGATFWRGAVTAILGARRDEALDELTKRGFIIRNESSILPDEVEYRFDHALTARVASGNLLESARKRYHLIAAEWLAARAIGGAMDLATAHHFEAAGCLERAVPFYGRAGDRALAAYDGSSALRLMNRALRAYGVIDRGLDPVLHIHLLTQRGEARRMLANYPAALVDFEAAANVAREVGEGVLGAAAAYRAGLTQLKMGAFDEALEAAVRGDEMLQEQSAPEVAAIGYQLRAELLLKNRRLDEAGAPLDKALNIWRGAGDRWALAHGLHTLGSLQAHRNEFLSSRRSFREAAVLRESLGDTHGLAETLNNLGLVAEKLGHFSEALGDFNRSLLIRRRLDDEAGVARLLVNQAVGYMRCGFYGRAQKALVESRRIHEKLEYAFGVAVCEIDLGHLYCYVGVVKRAEPLLEKAKNCFQELGDLEGVAECLVVLGRCRLIERKVQKAQALIEEAFRQLGTSGGDDVEAQALRLAGSAYLMAGEVERARELAEELEWNETTQRTPERQLEASLLTGQILLAEKRFEAAMSRFEEGAAIAREHDLAPGRWLCCHYRKLAKQSSGAIDLLQAENEARQAFQELLARVEDDELILHLRKNAERMTLLSELPP